MRYRKYARAAFLRNRRRCLVDSTSSSSCAWSTGIVLRLRLGSDSSSVSSPDTGAPGARLVEGAEMTEYSSRSQSATAGNGESAAPPAVAGARPAGSCDEAAALEPLPPGGAAVAAAVSLPG